MGSGGPIAFRSRAGRELSNKSWIFLRRRRETCTMRYRLFMTRFLRPWIFRVNQYEKCQLFEWSSVLFGWKYGDFPVNFTRNRTPHQSNTQIQFQINPRRVTLWIGIGVGTLMVVCGATQILEQVIDRGSVSQVVAIFNVGLDANVLTWWSSLTLLFCALLLAVIAAEHQRRGNGWHRAWWFLSTMVGFMSVDEVAKIHETIGNLFGHKILTLLGRPAELGGFTWVYAFLVPVVLILVGFYRFYRELPRHTRILFAASVATFLAGAIGVRDHCPWHRPSRREVGLLGRHDGRGTPGDAGGPDPGVWLARLHRDNARRDLPPHRHRSQDTPGPGELDSSSLNPEGFAILDHFENRDTTTYRTTAAGVLLVVNQDARPVAMFPIRGSPQPVRASPGRPGTGCADRGSPRDAGACGTEALPREHQRAGPE